MPINNFFTHQCMNNYIRLCLQTITVLIHVISNTCGITKLCLLFVIYSGALLILIIQLSITISKQELLKSLTNLNIQLS